MATSHWLLASSPARIDPDVLPAVTYRFPLQQGQNARFRRPVVRVLSLSKVVSALFAHTPGAIDCKPSRITQGRRSARTSQPSIIILSSHINTPALRFLLLFPSLNRSSLLALYSPSVALSAAPSILSFRYHVRVAQEILSFKR